MQVKFHTEVALDKSLVADVKMQLYLSRLIQKQPHA